MSDVTFEQKIIATAPEHCKPRSCKRYVDGVICQVHTGMAEQLQQHMNTVDPLASSSRKQQYVLLGCQVHQKGRWKCEVHREVHRVQKEDAHWPVPELYIPPPKHQTLGVVRTLMNRCEPITTEEAGQEGRDGTPDRSLKSMWLSILGLENRSQTTQKRRKRPTVGQRTKTTWVKWLSHVWRESRKKYTA